MGLSDRDRGRLLDELLDFLATDDRRWLSPFELMSGIGGGPLDDLAPVQRERRRILESLDDLEEALANAVGNPPRWIHLQGKRTIVDAALLALAPEIALLRPALGEVIAPLWFVAHLRPSGWDRVATLLGRRGLARRLDVSCRAPEGGRDVVDWVRTWLERTRLAWVRRELRRMTEEKVRPEEPLAVSWRDLRDGARPEWTRRDADAAFGRSSRGWGFGLLSRRDRS